LNVLADGNATHATDALSAIPNHGGAGTVYHALGRELGAAETHLLYPDLFCHALEFAVTVAYTVGAFLGMIGKEQFHHQAASLSHPLRFGMDFHPVGHGEDTRSDQVSLTLNFAYAHAALAGGVTRFEPGAEGGNVYPCLFCRFINGGTALYLYLDIVNGYSH